MNIEFLSGHIATLQPEIDLSQVDIFDIALGLSRESRFFGQTRKGAYPVTQHSCLCYLLFAFDAMKSRNFERIRTYGKPVLLHDGPEAIIKDIPTQVKKWLGISFEAKEDELTAAYNKQFNIPSSEDITRVVKEYDHKALVIEKQLFTFIKIKPEDEQILQYIPSLPPEFTKIMTPEESMDRFLSFYRDVS